MSSDHSRPSVFTPFLRRFTDQRKQELSETAELYNEVRAAHFASVWAHHDAIDHVNTLIAGRVADIVDLPKSSPLLKAFDRCQQQILALETTIFSLPEVDLKRRGLSMKQYVELRHLLRAKQHFLANDDLVSELLIATLAGLFTGLISKLPNLPEAADRAPLTVPLVCLVHNPGDLIARMIATICQREVAEVGLFTILQQQLYRNACLASGVSPEDEKPRKPLIEADNSDLGPMELVETYLKDTPFLDLFLCPVPFTIPEKTRFEHQWIVAPPGAGKSTLLQYLILRDLELVAADQASIVVMESNRDLIKAIEGLKVFAPGERLDGKLVTIDAEDIEWPIALNLFDVGKGN